MMMPDDRSQSREAYAAFVIACIERIFSVSLPKSFLSAFLGHARYIDGFLDYEDFGAYVLVECQERKVAGLATDEKELLRMLDRIRHRLVRQLSHRPRFGEDWIDDRTDIGNTPDQLAAASETVFGLTESELLLLTLVSEGGIENAVKELKKSPATIYRQLASIKEKLKR
jgi:hypothetical protein